MSRLDVLKDFVTKKCKHTVTKCQTLPVLILSWIKSTGKFSCSVASNFKHPKPICLEYVSNSHNIVSTTFLLKIFVA